MRIWHQGDPWTARPLWTDVIMPGGKIPQGGCQLDLPCVGHDADKARRQQGVNTLSA